MTLPEIQKHVSDLIRKSLEPFLSAPMDSAAYRAMVDVMRKIMLSALERNGIPSKPSEIKIIVDDEGNIRPDNLYTALLLMGRFVQYHETAKNSYTDEDGVKWSYAGDGIVQFVPREPLLTVNIENIKL